VPTLLTQLLRTRAAEGSPQYTALIVTLGVSCVIRDGLAVLPASNGASMNDEWVPTMGTHSIHPESWSRNQRP